MKRYASVARTAQQAPAAANQAASANRMSRTDAYRRLHRLLAEAGLRACRVEYDPVHDNWTVYAIQSTRNGAWQDFTLQVRTGELGDAHEHSAMRQRLVVKLATALAPRDASH